VQARVAVAVRYVEIRAVPQQQFNRVPVAAHARYAHAKHVLTRKRRERKAAVQTPASALKIKNCNRSLPWLRAVMFDLMSKAASGCGAPAAESRSDKVGRSDLARAKNAFASVADSCACGITPTPCGTASLGNSAPLPNTKRAEASTTRSAHAIDARNRCTAACGPISLDDTVQY
jgi:hypothetical protein